MQHTNENGVRTGDASSSRPKPQKLKEEIIRFFDDLASRPRGDIYCRGCGSLLQHSGVTFFSPYDDRTWVIFLPVCFECDQEQSPRKCA
jgi:hypothetical protein